MQVFKPGDLLEIQSDHGLAYVLVTHDHPSYALVVRIFAGLHQERPSDLVAVAKGDVAHTIMIPLDATLQKLGIPYRVLTNVATSIATQPFPTFRTPIRDKQGSIVYWWFWDGRGLSYEANPNEEMNNMPIREITTANQFLNLLNKEQTQSGRLDGSRLEEPETDREAREYSSSAQVPLLGL